MRHGSFLAVLAVLAAVGCAPSKPLEDMVGYVPPTSLPAQPKRTLVADRPEQVWSQLIDFLESSAFDIEHVDENKRLLVARYSGDPGPYVDCGSIVTHQSGTLDQLPGSASKIALNYDIDEQPVILNRTLNLDSRIIIRLAPQSQGTVIRTDTTYVITKTIDIEDTSGAVRDGSRETVSFEAGNRGEFSKGTTCQPNGSLDLAVLQSLPNIIGSDDIDRAELQDDDIEVPALDATDDNIELTRPEVESDGSETAGRPSNATDDDPEPERAETADTTSSPAAEERDDWVLPEQGLPTAALPTPDRANRQVNSNGLTDSDDHPSQRTTAPDVAPLKPQDSSPTSTPSNEIATAATDLAATDDLVSDEASSTSIVEDTTRKLLESLDCRGDEWHFCDLVEITTPYRKRNIQKLFGLTVNTTDSFASQIVGRDLKLDILFPSFPSHLHIAYARRDGTVEHVMSSSDVWPADQAHQFEEANQTVPGPSGLAMIIAIASEKPVFSSPPEGVEDAKAYLDRLKQRLDALDAEDPDGSVAASQLLIYVENADT